MVTYNQALSDYITHHFAGEDHILREIRQNLQAKGLPAINIRPEEGRFLQLLAAAVQAKKAVEVGTLGGYSGVWITRGLAPGGKLITLEKDPTHARVAEENFTAAGVRDQVEILVGDAHHLLRTLSPQGPFDFLFIDAEKSGYPDYFDWGLENVRLGGIIAAHNAFLGGRILSAEKNEDVASSESFNRLVASNPRLISTIFPAGDGTLAAVKIA